MSKEKPNVLHTPLQKADSLTRPLQMQAKESNSLTKPATIIAPRSAAFDINFALNPLVASAGPIFTAINCIDYEQYHGSITLLYESLLNEFKTLEEKLRRLDYRSAIILAARYFLCTYIDEILSSPGSQLQAVWQRKPLLKTLQNELFGGERFFLILERASDDPKANIDLLELGFLILSLGFKGKYVFQANNPRELEHIRDNLYALIKKYRGDLDPPLLTGETDTSSQAMKKRKFKRIPHLMIATIIFIVGGVSVYIPYQMHLNNIIAPLQSSLSKIANSHSNTTGNTHD